MLLLAGCGTLLPVERVEGAAATEVRGYSNWIRLQFAISSDSSDVGLQICKTATEAVMWHSQE